MFFLAALDSAGVPLVGAVDAMLITVATVSPAQAYLAALSAVVGSVAGAVLLFTVARRGGHALLARHTAAGRGARLRQWFERYGLLTVFVPAVSPIPMPMKIPVFCAAVLEVGTLPFAAVILAARLPRYLCLAYLGQRYGRQTLPFLRQHSLAVFGAIAITTVLAVLMLRWLQTRQAEPLETPQAKAVAAADSAAT